MASMSLSYEKPEGIQRGGMAFPKLFNVSVDIVVRHCLSLTVEDNSAPHGGLGLTVGMYMGVFYADDGMIGLRDP